MVESGKREGEREGKNDFSTEKGKGEKHGDRVLNLWSERERRREKGKIAGRPAGSGCGRATSCHFRPFGDARRIRKEPFLILMAYIIQIKFTDINF